jgi:hypothetical protein
MARINMPSFRVGNSAKVLSSLLAFSLLNICSNGFCSKDFSSQKYCPNSSCSNYFFSNEICCESNFVLVVIARVFRTLVAETCPLSIFVLLTFALLKFVLRTTFCQCQRGPNVLKLFTTAIYECSQCIS